MPVWIYTKSQRCVSLGVKSFHLTILLKNCSTMFTSHMKEESRWICFITRMAVYTIIWNTIIVYYLIFIKSGKVTLVKAHLTIQSIAWSNTTICQAPFIKGIVRHVHSKILILRPLAILLYANSE